MAAVAVIGGGASGLAAALSAAQRGFKVTLIEAGARLGGRLTTYSDRRAGRIFDNCEHLITAGYFDTLKLLKMMDAEDTVEIQSSLEIPFYHSKLGRSVFRVPLINPALGFLAGVFNFKFLSFSERLALIRRLNKLKSPASLSPRNAGEWLAGASQAEYEYFWKPFIVSVMNCLPDEADISILRRALVEGFMNKGGLGFFREPLEEVFHKRTLAALKRAGVEVTLHCPVREILVAAGRAKAVRGNFSGEIAADSFIISIPPHSLSKISASGKALADIGFPKQEFEYSEIYCIHIVFERRIFPDDFGCLLDTLPQWFFQMKGGRKLGPGEAYNLVISAADKLIAQDSDLITQSLTDLRSIGADLDDNPALYQRIVRNRRATVKFTSERQDERPGAVTGLENVFLAGDWIDTGLPATIESAVRSGFSAGGLV